MSTMDQSDQLTSELVFVLQQCEEMYERLLPIIKQEKKAALASNPDQLSSLNDEKANLVAQLKKLDRHRDGLLRKLAVWADLPQKELTLSRLIDRLPAQQGNHLAQLNETLKTLFVKVQAANSESRMVMTHCLTLVRNSLNFFNLWTDAGTSYGASGSLKNNVQGHGRLLSNSV